MSVNSIVLDTESSILFVGNSFTFGRVDPVMSYNTANVRDLTAPVAGTTFANTTGSNAYEPHPWGGVPGIFKAFTDQVGIDYDVALSTRNAATLQGQYLNSNPAGWDLRGNVASQSWDTVVLQENSTQALPSGAGSITFAAGSSTATLVIDPTADTTVETNETVSIQITSGSSYRTSAGLVTGTILNDDPTGPIVDPALPTVTLVASPGAVLEDGTQTLVYTFTRTGSATSALTIQFGATRDGSTAPSVNTSTGDFENFASNFTTSFRANGAQTTGSVSFTSGTGSVVIPAGATSATFTLDPRSDATVENDESVRLTLTASANYNVGTQGAVAVSILNDDFAAGTDTSLPNITLNLGTSGLYENGTDTLIYQFARTGSTTDALTVQFNVTGTATLPSSDFTVTGATTFTTGGAADPNQQSFNTYAVKLAEYATTGAADGTIPANPNANAATDVYLYETWARPNLVTGAQVATTDDITGAVTTTTTTAPEFYTSLEAMTADLVAAYEGLAAANPIFQGVAPVGAAFLQAVQDGTATRNPYASDASTDGKIDLWWDDNLHASKYGSYLSALTLFGTITGIDPRALGAGEKAAADLGITPAEAVALQAVAAATLGISLNANWTAPGQVTELQGGSGLLATAGSFAFSDADAADAHSVSVAAVTDGALGSLVAHVHSDSTGDGTGGAVNWTYTVDNDAVRFLAPGDTRIERFLVTVADGQGGEASREIAVTINGNYNNPLTISSNGGGATANVSIPENSAGVTIVTGSDVDTPIGQVSYSIVELADHNLFQIDSASGALSFKSAPDFENPTDIGTDNFYDVTVQVSDGTSVATQALTVSVLDTNDAAVIGGVDSQGVTETNAVLSTGGTLTIADVDSPATFATQANVAGSGGFGLFSIDALGVWTWTANSPHDEFIDGGTYTDTLTVTSTDGTTHVLTVTILGTNDNAVVGGSTTGAVVEAGGVNNTSQGTPTATGTLTATDADNPANTFTAVSTATASAGGYGTFTMTSDGVWTYTLDNSNPTIQALSASGGLTDTFTVTASDGTAQEVQIVITGAADAGGPTLQLPSTGDTDKLIDTNAFDLTANRAAIYRLYQTVFARSPDLPGFEGHVASLDGGGTLAQVIAGFTGSSEFTTTIGQLNNVDFVTRLYENALGRAPELAGLTSWVDLLNAGVSRENVILGVSQSVEATDNSAISRRGWATSTLDADIYGEVYRLYHAALNRDPDVFGMTGWTDRLDANTPLSAVASGFANSTEFQQNFGTLDTAGFVTSLYNNVLHRAPDSAGLNNWVAAINGGASRSSVLLEFSESQESIATNASGFQAFMESGLPEWHNTLAGGPGQNDLLGGRGSNTFVFDSRDTATDNVYGVQPWSTLEFENFGYTLASDSISHMTQAGGNVVFSDQGTTVTFHDTTLAMLSSIITKPV